MNALVHAAWTALHPPKRATADYRDRAIIHDELRAADQCEIPTTHIRGPELGLSAAEDERGTIYCPWCPDFENGGCMSKATPERMAAFQAALEDIRHNNMRADDERERCKRYQARVVREMRTKRGEE